MAAKAIGLERWDSAIARQDVDRPHKALGDGDGDGRLGSEGGVHIIALLSVQRKCEE
jgi:hypothetical protein